MRGLTRCALALLFLCWAEPARAERDVVRLAYPLQLFTNVDIDDAQAAVEVWINALTEVWGLPFAVEAEVFEDSAALAAALAAGELDIVGLFPLHYVEVRARLAIEPALVPAYDGEMEYRSVVLVREDAGVGEWADLAGKELVVARAARGDLGRLWVDVELMRRGLGEAADFFGQVREVDRTAQAVLPVFLGNATACLVPQEQFATMVELNPQLGRELVALGVSPAACYGLVCYRPGFDPARWALLEGRLVEMHNQPLGRQIFDVFHYGQLAPFDSTYIEGLTDLVAEHEALRAAREGAADE